MCLTSVFFFQAEDGIRDLVRSRGLGDVYKRQGHAAVLHDDDGLALLRPVIQVADDLFFLVSGNCLSLIHI